VRRPLLIGEASTDLAATALGPETRSGARLDRLLQGHGFDVLNLLSSALGPADDWPAAIARARAKELFEATLDGREVVLLGRRVARSFCGLSPHFDSLHSAPYFSVVYPTTSDGRGRWGRAMVWLAPHPSGRSRWWNDEAHRHQAAAFFSRILGRLEFPGPPALPTATTPEQWGPLAETRSWPTFR
jgi:hypothetical protein